MAAAIRTHVRRMKEERRKRSIRQRILFSEVFENADKVKLEYEDIEKCIVVLKTSEDPQVVLLIQPHASEAVSEFVKYGMKRAIRPTPLSGGFPNKSIVDKS